MRELRELNGTIRIETIKCSIQLLQQVKVKRTTNFIFIVFTHDSQSVFFINSIPFNFLLICYHGKVPRYGVYLLCGPIHMGKF